VIRLPKAIYEWLGVHVCNPGIWITHNRGYTLDTKNIKNSIRIQSGQKIFFLTIGFKMLYCTLIHALYRLIYTKHIDTL
ncbi:unnamed protein product, partial [Rotaria magnacalcarata]